jgi:hypothetical protein
MAKAKILPRESDLLATLTGFVDKTADPNDPASYPTDAVVTVSVVDNAGGAVALAQNLPMAYVAGTAGPDTLYRGVIPAAVVLVKGATYWAKIVATKGGAKHTEWVEFVAGPAGAP